MRVGTFWAMPISPLVELETTPQHRVRIEAALHAAVQAPEPYLTEVASHLLAAGGKRLRPLFAVAAAQVGDDRPVGDDVIRGAAACELVHLGSLYHDDVMDEADTRRGVETVNARWGNLQAVIAGDFLLARASEIAASLGSETAQFLAGTIRRLCEGQTEELKFTYRRDRSVESYLTSISGKTAALFVAAAWIGSVVAGHPPDVVDALVQAAEAYGMVFQIVDDVLDITATDAQLGKPAGLDMHAGVYTLPVLVTLAGGDAPARELESLLGAPLDGAQRARALEIVRNGPGLAAAVTTATEYATHAQRVCAALPTSAASDALGHAPQALLDAVTVP